MNYLIYGTSKYLVDEEIKKITKNGLTKFFMSETSLEEVLNDIRYNSIFEEEKSIVIYEASKCFKQNAKDELNGIDDFLEFVKNNKKTNFILVSDKKVNERLKINKEILSFFKIINTPIITKSSEFVSAISSVCKSKNIAFSSSAYYLLAEKCFNNIDIAINELNKLQNIENKSIFNELDVETLVSNYNMNNFYGFKDAVVNKNLNKARKLLIDLEASKANIISIVISLEKEYETIYNIKALANRKYTNERISSTLNNMHPYRVKLLKDVSNKYTFEKLESIILYLCNLNYKLVSGDNLGYGEIKKFLIELI